MLCRVCIRGTGRNVSNLTPRRCPRPELPLPRTQSQPWNRRTTSSERINAQQLQQQRRPVSPPNTTDDVEINLETHLDHPLPLPDSPRAGIPPTPGPDRAGSLLQTVRSNVSPHHGDLKSFLAYARRTGLNSTSTTYRGTLYEYVVQETLKRYGFELVRMGGRGDGGVDMLGFWRLAGATKMTKAAVDTLDHTPVHGRNGRPSAVMMTTTTMRRSDDEIVIPVLVQCKRHLSGKVSPGYVRELEGAIRAGNVPVGWRGEAVMGLLVGARPASKGVRDAMAGCRRAVGWICLEVAEDREEIDRHAVEWGEEDENSTADDEESSKQGTVRQMLWNRAANEIGLAAFHAVARYDGSSLWSDQPDKGSATEVILTRKGF